MKKSNPEPIPGVLMFVGHDGRMVILDAEVVDSSRYPERTCLTLRYLHGLGAIHTTSMWSMGHGEPTIQERWECQKARESASRELSKKSDSTLP